MRLLTPEREDESASSTRPRIARIEKAPEIAGEPILGLTIPDLLVEVCERKPNPTAYNQVLGDAWKPWSNAEFLAESNEMAAGLRELGLSAGERVALYMHSDVYFCLADMACLVAGLVNVPLYLAYTEELNVFVLDHSEARTVMVTDPALLREIAPALRRAESVENVIISHAQVPGHAAHAGAPAPEGDPSGEGAVLAAAAAAQRPDLSNLNLPERIRVHWMEDIRQAGAEKIAQDPDLPQKMRSELKAEDVATILYTSGTTGSPKGVMLTHQNITSNVTAGFLALAKQDKSGLETGLSFLPLTHVFARTLQFGFMYCGTSVYFTDPNKLAVHLREVKPTMIVAVPRVLERLYERILARGAELKGTKRFLFNWALHLAKNADDEGAWTRAQLQVADKLVLRKWREAVGGRLKLIVSGGAPLRAELANVFTAAGFLVMEGYGLTETSPIITASLPSHRRSGYVGIPLGGVEVAIAEDGEILTRGPHIMKGYYKNDKATQEAIDEEGWFHTGDVGEFSKDGFLKITDRKKSMFKLSTGKYVTPQPLENDLQNFPLVAAALVVGSGRKFCSALIFVNPDTLRNFAKQEAGLDPERTPQSLVREPLVQAAFQAAVHAANDGMPPWSTIKRFALVFGDLTVENKMLTPTLKMRRAVVAENYANAIESLYADTIKKAKTDEDTVIVACEPPSSAGVVDEEEQKAEEAIERAEPLP
jgi:long-chain acyl-CoA synthetase